MELYHVARDRYEKENLIFQQEYNKKARELLALLRQHMKKTGDMLTIDDLLLHNFCEDYALSD